MRDREKRRYAADRLEAALGAAMKPQLGRTTVTHHLDIAPQHALRMSGAEGFHRRFLRREPPGEMNRGDAPSRAVRDLTVCEDTLEKPLAVARDRVRDAVDVGRVEPEPDDSRHTEEGKRRKFNVQFRSSRVPFHFAF